MSTKRAIGLILGLISILAALVIPASTNVLKQGKPTNACDWQYPVVAHVPQLSRLRFLNYLPQTLPGLRGYIYD